MGVCFIIYIYMSRPGQIRTAAALNFENRIEVLAFGDDGVLWHSWHVDVPPHIVVHGRVWQVRQLKFEPPTA